MARNDSGGKNGNTRERLESVDERGSPSENLQREIPDSIPSLLGRALHEVVTSLHR